MAAPDDLRPRVERTRRSITMLPPHSTAAISREELLDLISLVLALAEPGSAGAPAAAG